MIHFKEPALPTERSRTTHHLVARGGGGEEGGRGVVVWTRAAQLPPMTVESARRRRFDFKRPTVAQVLTKKGQDGRVNCVSRARHKNRSGWASWRQFWLRHSRLFWSEGADTWRHHAIEVANRSGCNNYERNDNTLAVSLGTLTWSPVALCPPRSPLNVLLFQDAGTVSPPPRPRTSPGCLLFSRRITQLNFSQLHSPPARARRRHAAHAPGGEPDLRSVLIKKKKTAKKEIRNNYKRYSNVIICVKFRSANAKVWCYLKLDAPDDIIVYLVTLHQEILTLALS